MIERFISSSIRIGRVVLVDLAIPVVAATWREVVWPSIHWADRQVLSPDAPRMSRRTFLFLMLGSTGVGFWFGRNCGIDEERGRQRLIPPAIPTPREATSLS